MATAPPATHMPRPTSGLYPHHLASPYFSPISNNTSDSGFPWASMSPPPQQQQQQQQQRENDGQARKKSRSPSAADENSASSGGGMQLQFITVTKPNQFKGKEVMKAVRRKAMDHHLQTEGKPTKKSKGSNQRSRLKSETSNASVSSTGTPHDAVTDPSTITTTVSLRAPCISYVKASSPSASSASTHDRNVTSTTSSSRPFQSIMEPGPLISPARLAQEDGSPLPYDQHQAPLLVSLGKALDPFRTMFQSSHPSVSVEKLKRDCSFYFGTKALGAYWIPTALNHPHTFLGSLCLATAYNDVTFELPYESVQTIALRQEVIHLVSRNMLDPTKIVSDHNLMAVIQLVISEVIGREDMALRYHEDGIESMIRQRGGLDQLGLDGRLAGSVAWVSLAASALREERPRPIYVNYCETHSTYTYSPAAMIPESPIHYQHNDFQTLKRPEICTPKALDLLIDIKMMIEILLQETKQAHRNSPTLTDLYDRITNPYIYPSISELAKTTDEHDWRYEAIRIAAIIQATAIMNRVPLSEALNMVSKTLPPMYTSTAALQSNDSLISPCNPRRYSTITDSATSPSFPLYFASPAYQSWQSYFPTPFQYPLDPSLNSHRLSNSSVDTRPSISTDFTRPSFSSVTSASSEYMTSPAFAVPAALTKVASKSTPYNGEMLLENLRDAIGKSNMSQCWGDMVSVLLWIGLTVGAAAKDCTNKSTKKYFSAITMRAGIMLCFEHPQAINATALKMTRVVEALSSHTSSPATAQKGTNKRRKAANKDTV